MLGLTSSFPETTITHGSFTSVHNHAKDETILTLLVFHYIYTMQNHE